MELKERVENLEVMKEATLQVTPKKPEHVKAMLNMLKDHNLVNDITITDKIARFKTRDPKGLQKVINKVWNNSTFKVMESLSERVDNLKENFKVGDKVKTDFHSGTNVSGTVIEVTPNGGVTMKDTKGKIHLFTGKSDMKFIKKESMSEKDYEQEKKEGAMIAMKTFQNALSGVKAAFKKNDIPKFDRNINELDRIFKEQIK